MMVQDDLTAGIAIDSSAWLDEALAERGISDQPTKLFKYLSPQGDFFDRTLDDYLLKSRAFLSSVDMFNDPFDAQVDVRGMTKAELTALILRISKSPDAAPIDRNGRRRLVKNLADTEATTAAAVMKSVRAIGIHCVTEKWNNLLMWSHYACGHKGLVVIFSRKPGTYFHALPVRYRADYPILKTALDCTANIGYHTVARKSDIWKYEAEWRFFKTQGAGQYVMIEPETVEGIIFGLNCSAVTRNKVDAMLQQRAAFGLPPVKLFKARKVRLGYGISLETWPDGAAVATP